MELVRVETDEHKIAVKDLVIEYATILINKFEEHYDYIVDMDGLNAWVDDFMANGLQKFMSPKGYYFLSMVDGQAVGMGALHSVDEETAELKRMYVKSSFRGRKIGKAIYNQLLDVAKSDGYKSIVLDTFDFWKVAPQFYRSVGFKDTEPHPNAEPPPELVKHCIFMKLDLK